MWRCNFKNKHGVLCLSVLLSFLLIPAALSDYNRYAGWFNSDHNLYEGRVRIWENLSFAYIKSNGIAVGNQYSNSLRGAFNTSPLLPMYDDEGEFFNKADKSILDQNGGKRDQYRG